MGRSEKREFYELARDFGLPKETAKAILKSGRSYERCRRQMLSMVFGDNSKEKKEDDRKQTSGVRFTALA